MSEIYFSVLLCKVCFIMHFLPIHRETASSKRFSSLHESDLACHLNSHGASEHSDQVLAEM